MAAKKKAALTDASRTPQKCGALCSLCPLKDYGPPVWGEGPTTAKLAVVGEAPSRDDIKARRPFIGKSGELLDGYLSKLGLPRSQVFITNAVMCFPPGGDMKTFLQVTKKRTKEMGLTWGEHTLHPVEACRPRLFRELGIRQCGNCRKYETGPEGLLCLCKKPKLAFPVDIDGNPVGARPESVLGAGNMALLAIIGAEGITRWRGSPTNMERRAETKRREVFANMKKPEESDT